MQGESAEKFLESMKVAIAEDASAEHLDEFFDQLEVMMTLPVVLH
jgi:hypothetical protein